MELIDVKQHIGKSVLIGNLKGSGASVICVTNGDWFPAADLVFAVPDLTTIMESSLYPLLEAEIKELQGGTLDHPIDYLCFHLKNNTSSELVKKLIDEAVVDFSGHLWDPHYVMILHN